jgi:hypothetical protein
MKIIAGGFILQTGNSGSENEILLFLFTIFIFVVYFRPHGPGGTECYIPLMNSIVRGTS